ncbi:PorP/SprF family type IX secretion system membrane protein [Pedobacter gandavensis]|uniref:Type IX secretion system membrane protein PorP/SprF n=1 Tax=Pedobacter gandavensis TaxID=2679963 RepID=A0ABR6F0K0_9SPHI|nr:PorP/SprF family type IX secretion system membrane protein [Pedobacter gandavensis]MBB2151065.1 type IX secretion system membrane protein PorP/SprF [Pedobacter gandavensis]
MRIGKQLTMAILMMGASLYVQAQDHIYSQFFNAPVYLNPALTGQFEGDIRMNLIYRNQWSGLSGDLSYISASADLNIPSFAGGVGLIFNRSSEGTAYLVKNNAALTYAYSVGSDDLLVSFGVQAGFTNRQINWNKLVFSDQIDRRLGYIPGSVSSAQPPEIDNKFFFDAAAGTNVIIHNFMLGLGVHHLNQPDESFTGTVAKLPMRITANASYRLALSPYSGYGDDDGAYLIPSVVYYKQDKSSSLSMGAQFKFKSVSTGLWYRSSSQSGPDAVVFSLIFDLFKGNRNGEKLRLGISHDATTSRINYTNTSGTTEASIGYEKYFPNSGSYNKFNGLRCYDFY